MRTILTWPRRQAILHNVVFGRGNGWPEDKLYIVSVGEGLFEANVRVRGKKYW